MGTRAGGSGTVGRIGAGEGLAGGGFALTMRSRVGSIDARARGSEGETPNAGSRVSEAREDAPDARRIETFGWTAPVPRDDASPPPHHRRPESRRRENGRVLTRGAAADARRREAPSSSRKTSLASVRCARRGVARARDMPAASATSARAIRIHHGEIRSFYVRPTASKIRLAEALRTPDGVPRAFVQRRLVRSRLRSTSRRSRIHLATRRRHEPPSPPPSSSFSFSSSSPPVASARLNPSLVPRVTRVPILEILSEHLRRVVRDPRASSASPRHSRGGRYQCSGSMNGRPSCA